MGKEECSKQQADKCPQCGEMQVEAARERGIRAELAFYFIYFSFSVQGGLGAGRGQEGTAPEPSGLEAARRLGTKAGALPVEAARGRPSAASASGGGLLTRPASLRGGGRRPASEDGGGLLRCEHGRIWGAAAWVKLCQNVKAVLGDVSGERCTHLPFGLVRV